MLMLQATVTDRAVFVPSPGAGIGVMGGSYYTEKTGGRLISIHSLTSRSDTVDAAFVRASEDNGRTWGDAIPWAMKFAHAEGTGRRHPRGGYVDPASGRYISVWTEGVLPGDEPLEGMRNWTLHYSVSVDGGRTQTVNEQIIHEGPAYDAVHHLPGVRKGGNCVMIGDLGQRPLTRSDGVLLIPVQSSPADADGNYTNPGAGFTYTDCLLLMGRWHGDHLRWTCSQRIVGEPARTTRGLIEPTIAELGDGSILMVMRGSNDAAHDLPGHKWMAQSHDGGRTWTTPAPWTYDDGAAFHSPSACSQLLPWSDGRLLWMGNITPQNPRGNRPRYPLVLGEVDLTSGRLRRDSVAVIDDRHEGEHELLTLSNFYAREDRETGDLLLHLPRFFAGDPEAGFGSDLSLLRIAVR
ncbi:MAG: sialidase family protein [bacterium]|nr:sialidase family protein [bacterium]